jgi:hypothetical protein
MNLRLTERERLDEVLADGIDVKSRTSIWDTSRRVMDAVRPGLFEGARRTAMVLGYVQSGKTTSMSTLMALASDDGVDIVVALLGTTTLLLDQNASRLSGALGIRERVDYRWTELTNPTSKSDCRQIVDWVSKGRTVFVPILKHAKRIDALSSVLEDPRLSARRILIIDDEADQASLNTQIRLAGESRTHKAIVNLRMTCTNHAYVQFTATPYGLLLLDREDPLFPDVVEFLEPGAGYTGGKQFFIDSRESLIHSIPRGDEQGAQLPICLPRSLRSALASFLIGAADLVAQDVNNAPVSMLINPHAKTAVQERYRFLLQNYLEDLRDATDLTESIRDLGIEFQEQAEALNARLVEHLDPCTVFATFKRVVREAHISLLNSTTDLERVRWNESPIHILIGGNKLDRGFTVEGLTVTYMNRVASDQIDTTEQRARAFGYRGEYLPYCQFYASTRTIDLLTDVVRTEIDLREEIADALLRGESIRDWSETIGLLLPEGSKPTRDAVVAAVTVDQLGWHYVRRPSSDPDAKSTNAQTVRDLGLFDAAAVNYGRLQFSTVEIDAKTLVHNVLERWRVPDFSPNWQHEHLLSSIARTAKFADRVMVVLLDVEVEGQRLPREREWRDETGFVNIFQGRDNRFNPASDYPGDRAIGEAAFAAGNIMLQIHRIARKDGVGNEEFLVPAIFLGNRRQVRNRK